MKIVDKISSLSNGATSHHCAKNISLVEKEVAFDLDFTKFNTLKTNELDLEKGQIL